MKSSPRAMRVSLSMIVRNEAQHLRGCLASVADLVDEMVVVDTGSTDDTRQIAAACGALVFGFDWCDDFAAARNESLRLCRSPWVLWMDADDRILGTNRQALKALLDGLQDESAAYVMQCVSPRDRGGASVTEHVRLFRRHEHIRWRGRIHEQIRASVLACGHQLRSTGISFEHLGYFDAQARQRKAERNLRLLLREREHQPNDPFVLYNIGRTLQGLGRLQEALPHLQKALILTPAGAPFEQHLYALLAEVLQASGQNTQALAACDMGLRRFVRDPELTFHRACLLTDTGQLIEAARAWEQWLSAPPSQSMLIKDPQVRDKALHNFNVVQRLLQRQPAQASITTGRLRL